MRTLKIIALAGVAFAAVPLAIPVTGTGVAHAQSVQFSIDNVAIGYNDGYWDRHHQWHAWEKAEHRDSYRAARNAEYHDWRHDRDKDMGWHEHH